MLKAYEKIIKDNHKKSATKIKKELADFYEEFGDDISKEFKKYKRQDKMNELVRQVIMKTYAENNKYIRRALYDVINTDIINTKDTLKDEGIKPIEFKFDVAKIVNSDMSGLQWTERQGMSRDYTIKKVQESITAGMNKGSRYSDIAKDISKRLDVSEYKSLRIVRTESHRCLNESRFESYEELKEAGFDVQKKWVSSRDERVRSSHSDLDGQIVDVDEPFEINGYEAMYPGGFGVPELDINCRCTTSIVIN